MSQSQSAARPSAVRTMTRDASVSVVMGAPRKIRVGTREMEQPGTLQICICGGDAGLPAIKPGERAYIDIAYAGENAESGLPYFYVTGEIRVLPAQKPE